MLFPTNSKNLGRTSSIEGLSFIKSLVIPVSSWTFKGIGIWGFINSPKLSIISLFLIFTAPISVISSEVFENPVVSISKTTYSSSKFPSVSIDTIFDMSFTR